VFARSPACVFFCVLPHFFACFVSVFLFFAVCAQRLVPCFCEFLFYSLVSFFYFSEFGRVWRVY
jgi:hypothetical protein